MLPVQGRPFLEYLVWNLARHGVQEIILSCGYLGDQVVRYFQRRHSGRSRIRCVIEPEPLGTGGALRFLADTLQENFFLLNGDSLFDINYLDLPLVFPDPPPPGAMVMALRHVPDASRYGRVFVTDHQITHFVEKASDASPGLINAGLAWVQRTVIDALPEGVSALEEALFPSLIAKNALFGKVYEGYFIDIGLPDAYRRAELTWSAWHDKPTIFFDRDGVINRNHGYVHTPDQFEWVAGAREAIRWCNDHGYLAVVITNQSGIARGYYDEAQFDQLTAWIQTELAKHGAHIDATYHCPHHPTQGIGRWRTVCRCRKPKPGMLERAISEWHVDKKRSLFIGDKASDMAAAQQAGIAGHLFAGGNLAHFLRHALASHAKNHPTPR